MVADPSADDRPGHHLPADFPAPVRALAAVSRALAVLEGAGIAVCLISLVALAVFQFIARNVRLGASRFNAFTDHEATTFF